MSPLRPKFLFSLISKSPSSEAGLVAKRKRRYQQDQLFRIATIFVAFGWSIIQGPANAGEVSWGGTGTPYPGGSGVNTDFSADGLGASGEDSGVNLRFFLDTTNDGATTGSNPQPGNELSGTYPNSGVPAAEGQGGQTNPNTPLTGGLTRGNILLGIDSDTLAGFQAFSVELFNDFGDLVPANNVTYTIIDLDRSCNRDNATDEVLWQDVVSTRALVGGQGGAFVTPDIIDGPAAGATGTGTSETVENITGNELTGSSLAVTPGSVTFRGITDPTPGAPLDETEGNVNCNDNNSPGTTADNDDNRNVEAANNSTQGQAEGNVSLQTTGRLVDRIEFQFGNGAPLSTNNGLGTTSGTRFSGGTGVPANFVNDLQANPLGHGVGVLGDFSFEPAIIGISETATEPVFEGPGAQPGQWVVKYSLLVENSGQVDLTNVQVTNDLDATFGAGNYSVVPGSITIDGGGQPDTFTGSGAGNVITIPDLAGSTDNDPNTPGGSSIVMFQVSFDAEDAAAATGQGGSLEPFFSNQSTVVANPIDPNTGGASTIYTVRDRSSNGQEDPNTGGAVTGLLDVDADVDDDDDGDGANDGPTFANPFTDSNVVGTTIDKAGFGTITREANDNDPTNNDSPTIVRVTPTPRIGVTKQVTGVTALGGGQFDVTYRHYVCNRSAGEITLSDVQLTEDLNNTFRLGQPNGVTAYTVQSISSPATPPEALPAGTTYSQLTVNPAFNGQGDQNIINATGNTLAPTDCSVVDFVVRVTPGTNTGDDIGGDPPYDSQVETVGTGSDVGATEVRDLSDDVTAFPAAPLPIAEQLPRDTSTPPNGTTNDPVDGAGVPQPNPRPAADPNSAVNENNQTPVSFLPPQIGVTKQVTGITDSGNGTFTVSYRQIVCNLGDEDLVTVDLTETSTLAQVFRQGNPNGVTSATFVPGSLSSPATAPAGFDGATYTPLSVNTSFDGSANLQLGTAASLSSGNCSIVDYQVLIDPTDPDNPLGQNLGDGSATDPANDDPAYDAQVQATGIGATSNATVTDLSDDVTNLDPASPLVPVFAGSPLPVAQQLPRDLNGNGTATDPVDGNTGAPISSPNPTDPNNDETTDENNRTAVSLVPNPEVGITKQITAVTDNGDGTFTVSYRQIACNLGNEGLNSISVSETGTLATVFREGQANGVTSAQFVPGSLTSPATAPAGFDAATYTPLSVNANFDGAADLQLATAANLPAGNCSVVDYQVLINPTDPADGSVQNLGDGTAGDPANDDPAYEAQAQITGTGTSSGTTVSDLSDDVTSLDAPLPVAEQQPRDLNGNGTATDPVDGAGAPVSSPIPADPANDETTDENNRTPIVLVSSLEPEIGLTKQIVNLVDNGVGPDGRRSYDVTFEYRVCNTGDAPLNGLTISDNYDEQFAANDDPNAVADYQIISVTPGASTASGPLVASTAAGNGTGSGEILLAAGEAIAFAPNTNPTATDGCTGDSALVQTVVRVFDPDLSAVYDASAVARGTSLADGAAVSDLSDDIPQFGAADPDNGVGTPGPGANPTNPADPLNTPTLLQFSPLQLFKRITSVTLAGVTTQFNTVVGNVPDPSFVGEVDARSLGDLQSGDTVEYTIYYFNRANVPFTALEICDAVPSPLTVTAVPGGTALSPLVPRGSCINPETGEFNSGSQGAAVFTVGDVPAGGTGSVSFTTAIP